jgi:flagellar biosynthesis protein FlhG
VTAHSQADGLLALRTPTVVPLKRPRRFLSITGGKGGVGKSTIALNLAVLYAKAGSTIAVDADFGMADLNLLLDLAPPHSMLDVVDGLPVDEAIAERHGIHFLAALNGSHRLANADRITHRRVMEILGEVRHRYDTVVVDMPAGIERNALAITAMATEVLIVATPEPLSLADAYAVLKVLSAMHGIERAFLVPNQIRSPEQAEELAAQLTALVEHFLGIELVVLPHVPHDPNVPKAAAAGCPIAISRPDAPITRALSKVIRALGAHLSSEEVSK